MATGTVKWFNSEKGYGFIQQESGPDIFVHHTSIEMSGYRTLEEGQEVEFEFAEGEKGLCASMVRLAGALAEAGEASAAAVQEDTEASAATSEAAVATGSVAPLPTA